MENDKEHRRKTKRERKNEIIVRGGTNYVTDKEKADLFVKKLQCREYSKNNHGR